MKIAIVGAAGGEVTGSAYYVQTKKGCVLVDCGLSRAARNQRPTHWPEAEARRCPAHSWPSFAAPRETRPFRTSVRHSRDPRNDFAHPSRLRPNERRNRKRERAGEPPQEPLCTPEHAEAIIQCLKPVPYQQPVTIAPGIQAIWAESGHMLGSASIQLIVEEDGRQERVVFSGDLGPKGAALFLGRPHSPLGIQGHWQLRDHGRSHRR